MNLQEVAEQLHGNCQDLKIDESRDFTLNPPLDSMSLAVLQMELGRMDKGAHTHLCVAFNGATVTIFRAKTPDP